ncbi:UNVERIFIED_CONTAM: hypothetical protein GTU68_058671 [Idotea baltica]|nr:hypothetical protein [Idotea baltica]
MPLGFPREQCGSMNAAVCCLNRRAPTTATGSMTTRL